MTARFTHHRSITAGSDVQNLLPSCVRRLRAVQNSIVAAYNAPEFAIRPPVQFGFFATLMFVGSGYFGVFAPVDAILADDQVEWGVFAQVMEGAVKAVFVVAHPPRVGMESVGQRQGFRLRPRKKA